MTRDELLTKVAMELAEWPADCKSLSYWDGVHLESSLVESEWRQRRAELINEPDDANAPECAEWKMQDGKGDWGWFNSKPFNGSEMQSVRRAKTVSAGHIPAGHDWRDTLKRVERRPSQTGNLSASVTGSTEGNAYTCPGCHFELDNDDAADMREHGLCGQCVTALAGTEGFKHEDLANPGTPVSANGILGTAWAHLHDRAATYDKQDQGGERSIGAAVEAFRAVTGDGDMNTAERGWLFMLLLKTVRTQQGEYRADNYQDATAYAALMGEAAAGERRQ